MRSFHEVKVGEWLVLKQGVMKWTFIHQEFSKALGYYWNALVCWNENELILENRTGEKKRRGGAGGGQTNKQTTHRFPAALRRSWRTPHPPPSGYTHLHLC